MSQRLRLLTGLLLALAAAAAKQPNIIFMILDDMDSALNATDVMPNYVRRLQTEGMHFPNAFVASPKCCPSRTSLLSGRFSHRLNDTALGWCGDFLLAKRWNTTFMADVKAAGYSNGFFGKLVNEMGGLCSSAATARHLPAGFSPRDGDRFLAMCNEGTYYENTFNSDGALVTTGARGNASAYLTAFLGNETLAWLTRVAAAAAGEGGRPFFAYLAPHAPHLPAEPAPWYAAAPLPSDAAPRPPAFNAFREGKGWAIGQNPPFAPFTEAGIDLHFRNRQRALMSVDDTVRDVFAALEAAGVLDNTYVIATSDHGYHLCVDAFFASRSLPAPSWSTPAGPLFHPPTPHHAPAHTQGRVWHPL
jgi:N-acetylglucosamine-6-sulfatase